MVRDRILQIIREDGAEPVTYIAGAEEYRNCLRDKLGEEVTEFLEADDAKAPEELADVLEVVHALAATLIRGTSERRAERTVHRDDVSAHGLLWPPAHSAWSIRTLAAFSWARMCSGVSPRASDMETTTLRLPSSVTPLRVT